MSGLEIVSLQVKSCGAPPAVLGRAGSKTDLASDCYAAAGRCMAPRNLCRFVPRPHAAAGAVLQRHVLSLGLFGLRNDS
jgi:hypothetical protein